MDELTVTQRRILKIIQRHIKRHKIPPTRREISENMGYYSDNAAQASIMILARKGYIKVVPKMARGIQLLKDEHGQSPAR